MRHDSALCKFTTDIYINKKNDSLIALNLILQPINPSQPTSKNVSHVTESIIGH